MKRAVLLGIVVSSLLLPPGAAAQLAPISGNACAQLGILCTGADVPANLSFRFELLINAFLFLLSTVAVGYLIYAGYKYINSQGDQESAAAAKRQIGYAVLGLVVAGGAYLIRNATLLTLLAPPGTAGAALVVNLLIRPVINALLVLAAVAAVAYTVVAGIMYFSSSGEEDKASAAKRQLTYGLLGIAIVLLSAALVNFIILALG